MVGPHDLLASPLSSTPFGAKTRPAKRPHELLAIPSFEHTFRDQNPAPKTSPPKGALRHATVGSSRGPKNEPGTGPEKGRDRGPFQGPWSHESKTDVHLEVRPCLGPTSEALRLPAPPGSAHAESGGRGSWR